MADGKVGLLRRRLKDPEVRDQILRILSIALMLVAVGACVVLAFMMHLEVLLLAFSGVLALALAFFLFARLWPRQEEPEFRIGEKVAQALGKPKREPMSPEEYRRQRELAQKMIREKAAPTLDRAIRGILRQEEQKQRRKK